MNDIVKLMIEIPEQIFLKVCDSETGIINDSQEVLMTIQAIQNGTVLSECEDCISRFSAEQLVRKEFCNIPSKIYNKLMVEFDELSSVTPKIEPKTGHWIAVHPLQPNDEGDYMCSECRCGGLVWKPTTYCPNCGAEMEQQGENT